MPLALHIIGADDWRAAQAAGVYTPYSLASQGFIHLSWPHQVLGPAEALFADRDDLLLLAIDTELLSAPVREEDCYDEGQAYPHLYGALELSAVVKVLPFPRGPTGFALPDLGADIRWRWTDWSGLGRDDLHDLARLRQEVFVVEQECAYLDLDGRDPEAFHLLGRDGDGLAAYLRAFGPEQPVIGRVVVAPRRRGEGLGRRLMEEGRARVEAAWGPGPLRVGAQARLERFYASLGYVVCGPGYDEDGIWHVPMERG